MPLLTGSVSLSRFNVISKPPSLDFDSAHFREIAPGSEVRESAGFVPLEIEAPWEVGTERYVFRVRIDRLRPDPVAVKERVKQLVQAELDSGMPFVGPKKRKRLKEMAEEELILSAVPSSRFIEACLDGDVLHVASSAKNVLGIVLAQLRRIGVIAEAKTPWADRGEPEIESDIIEAKEPGESVRGCRFLRNLVGDREVLIEPESGYVRLQTHDARITLTGGVLPEMHRLLEAGAEILGAKMITGETRFRFDAMSFRLSGLRVETGRHEHWIELLDERLDRFNTVWDLLDGKYGTLGTERESRARRLRIVPHPPPAEAMAAEAIAAEDMSTEATSTEAMLTENRSSTPATEGSADESAASADDTPREVTHG
ncbi:MAG: hypothetical protein AAGD38_12795 [Acidobacteriota bacterium]